MRELKELEKRIGYHFQNPELLEKALRHSSYANEHKMNRIECNERLEFLGDAVLELVSSEHLFAQFPQMPEGELTRLRASLVCEPTLAFCAREIELGSFLRLGKGEEMTGGRHRDSVTSDALESVIGAVYLDGGFANAKEFVLKYVLNDMEHKKLFFDSKTIFQEMVQGNIPGEISYHRWVRADRIMTRPFPWKYGSVSSAWDREAEEPRKLQNRWQHTVRSAD